MTRDEWLDLDEACELTGRGKRTIRRWSAGGLVKRLRPNRIAYYHRQDLLKAAAIMDEKIEQPTFERRHAGK